MDYKKQAPKNIKKTNKVEVNLGLKQCQTPHGNAAHIQVNMKSHSEEKQQRAPPRRNSTKPPMAVVDVPDPTFLLKQQQMIIKQQTAMIKQQQAMLAAAQKQLDTGTVPKKPSPRKQQAPKGQETKLVLNVKLDK